MGQLYSDIQLWEWPLRVQKEEHVDLGIILPQG